MTNLILPYLKMDEQEETKENLCALIMKCKGLMFDGHQRSAYLAINHFSLLILHPNTLIFGGTGNLTFASMFLQGWRHMLNYSLFPHTMHKILVNCIQRKSPRQLK